MEVGKGPNLGCIAKGKEKNNRVDTEQVALAVANTI
jgi:hypothetical protein